MSMCVVVPSRGRPHNIARLCEAWFDTGADALLVVCVDNDDPDLAGYAALSETMDFDLVVGPPSRIGPILNSICPAVAEEVDIVGFMGDDHLPRTEGWDAAIEAVTGRFGVTYGNDLLQGANLATAVFIGSGIVQTLGYYVPPGLQHLYFESPWMAWGRGLDSLTYLDDVVIEHLHYVNGKAEPDALYAEVNSGSMYARDGARWAEYEATELPGDIARLREAAGL